MLPGLEGFMNNSLTTWTFVASDNENDIDTVLVPTGTQVGDLIVLWDVAINSSGLPTAVTPTGFTVISSLTILTRRTIASYKIATASDIGATITGMSGTSVEVKIIASFRPDATIGVVNINSLNEQTTSADPTSQTITSTGATTPAILIGMSNAAGALTETGTLVTNGVSLASPSTSFGYFYEIQNLTKTNRTFDIPDNGNTNTIVSFYVTAA